jgi:repressor LexA
VLTRLEKRILDFVRDYGNEHGESPLLREIGAAVGVSSRGTLHRYVQSLVNKGFLTQAGEGKGRQLRLTEERAGGGTLPLLGRIAAGRPIEAISDQREVDFAALLGGDRRYVLKVVGDSMIDIGIYDGDLVVCEPQDTAEDGDIVVALIDDSEATLKRFRHCKNGQVLLIPENSTMAPMEYDAERVRIQGVLVAQVRTYA